MFVQQIPCAQTSTSDLVATTGMSGLGARMRAPVAITRARRLGIRGLGAPTPKQGAANSPVTYCYPFGSGQYVCVSTTIQPNGQSVSASWHTYQLPLPCVGPDSSGTYMCYPPNNTASSPLRPAPLAPVRVQAMRTPGRVGMSGVGCCGCDNGLGTLGDGTGLFGTGLFSSGLDFSQWGLTDWAAAALGGYVLLSVYATTKHVARVTKRKVRAVAKA